MTDQRMPEMTGVELLEEARKKQPDAMRLLFTGYADEAGTGSTGEDVAADPAKFMRGIRACVGRGKDISSLSG